MSQLGLFVALLPLSPEQEAKPHWLYLIWDDAQACWLTKAALVDAESSPPDLTDLAWKTNRAPQKLTIICSPHHLRLDHSFSLGLAEKTIYAYKQSTDTGLIEPLWSYHVDETVIPRTVAETDFGIGMQDFPEFKQEFRDLFQQYEDWRDKLVTDAQVKSVILTYQDKQYKQLDRLGNYCSTMTHERASQLLATFSDSELLAMVQSNARLRDRLQAIDMPPNHCFGRVAKHLPLDRFQSLVNTLLTQGWDLYWAHESKREALVTLLRELNAEQQAVLLQHEPIQADIDDLMYTGYADIVQFMDACQFNEANRQTCRQAWLAQRSVKDIPIITLFNDYYRTQLELEVAEIDIPALISTDGPTKVKTLKTEFNDVLLSLQSGDITRISGWCYRKLYFNLFFKNASTNEQRRTIIDLRFPLFLKEKDVDKALLTDFFANFTSENLSVLLAMPEIKKIVKPRLTSFHDFRTTLPHCPMDVITANLGSTSTWLKTEQDISELQRNLSPKQFQALLLKNIDIFSKVIGSQEGLQNLILDLVKSSADGETILQILTALFEAIPRKNLAAIDFKTLVKMFSYPEEREIVFNWLYPEPMKTCLLEAKATDTDFRSFYILLSHDQRDQCINLLLPDKSNQQPKHQLTADADFVQNSFAAHANASAELYKVQRDYLQKLISSARQHLKTIGKTAPYHHLDLAEQILEQVDLMVKQSPPTLQTYVQLNQVLLGCIIGIESPITQRNLQHLKQLSGELAGNPSPLSKTLGVLLYTFTGALIIVGLLAAIPLSGGNILMSLCLAAKCQALAAVVAHSAWTAAVTMGSGITLGLSTSYMGFFSQQGLAGKVAEFSEKVQGTAPPLSIAP